MKALGWLLLLAGVVVVASAWRDLRADQGEDADFLRRCRNGGCL